MPWEPDPRGPTVLERHHNALEFGFRPDPGAATARRLAQEYGKKAMPTERSQLAYLDAMGIDLWVRREFLEDGPEDVDVPAQNEASEVVNAPDPIRDDPNKDAQSEPVDSASSVGTATPASDSGNAQGQAATAIESVAPDAGDQATAAENSVKTGDGSHGDGSHGDADVASPVESEDNQLELIANADLESLQSLVSACERCALSRTRNKTVFGSGNPDANWLFVSDAPGRDEDRAGEVFMGKPGELLNAMLLALGLTRDDVFITNVLKCRPPDSRDPMGEEVGRCEAHLQRQIDLVGPKVIVAMGRFAAQALLRSNENISRLRGSDFTYLETGIPLVVTYDPAYLLRTPDQKSKVWADLLQAKRIIDGG